MGVWTRIFEFFLLRNPENKISLSEFFMVHPLYTHTGSKLKQGSILYTSMLPLPYNVKYALHLHVQLSLASCLFSCNLFELRIISGYCTLIAGTFYPSVDTQVLHNMSGVVSKGEHFQS